MHLPTGPDGEPGTVEVFGAKELHEDGRPHYHVILRFTPAVAWRHAREKLYVYIDVDGNRRVDTTAINVKKRSLKEPLAKFVRDVTIYIAKDGVVFGTRFDTESAADTRRKRKLEALDAIETRNEAERYIRRHYLSKWVWNNWQCRGYLDTKRPESVKAHVPTFPVKPWRIPKEMQDWKDYYFPETGERWRGRPKCLVIEGKSGCGKTEWAQSWGHPAKMMGGWNVDELVQEGLTHIVLNDINISDFPHVREMLGCQEYVTCGGKYRPQRTVKLGLPVVWTCNEENSPALSKKYAQYMEDAGVVHVKIRDKLFLDEDAEWCF